MLKMIFHSFISLSNSIRVLHKPVRASQPVSFLRLSKCCFEREGIFIDLGQNG